MTADRQPRQSGPVGIAVIGCGRISTSHLDAIKGLPDLARLEAVVDVDLARAEETAARYGAPHAFDSLDTLFKLDAVEAVVICTPNEMHAAQSLAALTAGRHVLVEKPMGESVAEAAAMALAADHTGLVLSIGHTFRHSAPIHYLINHAGELGALCAIEVSSLVHWEGPQAPWWADRTPEQGLILSLFAPHALDFVQLFMGDDPVRVSVESARHQSGWRGEDEAMILLRYPGQRMASIHLSYNQAWIVDRKTLHYEYAMATIEDGDRLWINGDCRVGVPLTADEADARRRMGGRDLSPYFRNQLAEFVHAVRGRPSRTVDHAEGLRLTRLVDRVLSASLAG